MSTPTDGSADDQNAATDQQATVGSVDSTGSPSVPLPQVFRIAKIGYLAVAMLFVATIVMAGASLAWLGWTLLFPVILAWWMTHIRTIATEPGLRAVHTFTSRDIAWAEIAGLQFPKWGSVRAVLTDGSRVRLPAITFSDLPRLAAASGGRIPDPYAAAAAADAG